MQLEGTPFASSLELLRIFAYGTWIDYKGALRLKEGVNVCVATGRLQCCHFACELELLLVLLRRRRGVGDRTRALTDFTLGFVWLLL